LEKERIAVTALKLDLQREVSSNEALLQESRGAREKSRTEAEKLALLAEELRKRTLLIEESEQQLCKYFILPLFCFLPTEIRLMLIFFPSKKKQKKRLSLKIN
jgi:hypothetical protein